MVSQGEIKRYTLYALGEVVLIVIGILIALQVSDLTDTAKLEEKRLNLIERLERQIEINQFQTKEAIDELRTQLNNAHRIMGYMGKQEPQLDA
ncbi:MAG: hypothetical protein HRU12_03660, partial [Phaeodactylibacter sp.]|nr:hypothetical protein [Phaeodactylibacter sp.]